MEEVHLESFGCTFDSDSEVSDDFDVYSSDEVTSSVDETQNELIRLSTHLNIGFEDDEDSNEHYRWPSPPHPSSAL